MELVLLKGWPLDQQNFGADQSLLGRQIFGERKGQLEKKSPKKTTEHCKIQLDVTKKGRQPNHKETQTIAP